MQETLLKAWEHKDSLRDGERLKAWVMTILRNQHRQTWRKTHREVEDPEGKYEASLFVPADQLVGIDAKELLEAIQELPLDQREALILICIDGLSYQEAADICKCALGTMKSRVNRARARLVQLFELDVDRDLNWATPSIAQVPISSHRLC